MRVKARKESMKNWTHSVQPEQSLKTLFEQATQAMPYDVTSTGITQGDFEADDDDFVEYAEEFTFPVGRLFDEQLIAGGWVELRRDDDGVTITAFFGVARNGDWKNKRILPEDTAVQGHYDFENKTWEFWIDQY